MRVRQTETTPAPRYSEFDPIGDTERLSGRRQDVTPRRYSEFDPIGDTESPTSTIQGCLASAVTASSIR